MSNGLPLPQVPVGTTSKADKYGLAAWGSTTIDPGTMFPELHITGRVTADDVVKAFLGASPDVIAQVQQQLWLAGGYYTSSADITPGVIGPEDERAFSNFVQTIAETQNAQRQQQQPVQSASDYLGQAAALGQQQGALASVVNSVTGAGAVGKTTLSQSNPAELALTYQQQAQAELGYKPSQAEADAYAKGYMARERAMELQNAQASQSGTGGSTAPAAPLSPFAPPQAYAGTAAGKALGAAAAGSVPNISVQQSMPSPTTDATLAAQHNHPDAYAATQVDQQFQNFLNLIGYTGAGG